MRELFVIDLKNYNPDGTVGRRPSVRGIVIKDGKIAMMHSLKYIRVIRKLKQLHILYLVIR